MWSDSCVFKGWLARMGLNQCPSVYTLHLAPTHDSSAVGCTALRSYQESSWPVLPSSILLVSTPALS